MQCVFCKVYFGVRQVPISPVARLPETLSTVAHLPVTSPCLEECQKLGFILHLHRQLSADGEVVHCPAANVVAKLGQDRWCFPRYAQCGMENVSYGCPGCRTGV